MRSYFFHWLVFVCVVFVLVCPDGQALAQGGIFDDEPDPAVSHARIESMSLSVKVRGRLATTTMDLVFASTREDAQGILQWRMAPDAVVHDLVLWVEGLRIPCEVCPRASAKATYDRIVAAKVDPAIVEYIGGGVWNLSVFPVSPGDNRKVRVVYSQVLGYGKFAPYVGPRIAKGSPCDRVGKLDFEADIDCPGGVKDFSASRRMGVSRRGRTAKNLGKLIVGFRENNMPDYKIPWFIYTSAEPLPQVLSALADVDPDDQPGDTRVYLCHANCPDDVTGPAAKARNVVLVLDASGSMAGEPWKIASAAATAVLANITRQDRLNLVICGPEPKLWEDSLFTATAANIDSIKRMIAKTAPAEGTDLAGGLRAAAQFSKNGEPVEIIVIADGWDHVAARYFTVKPRPDDPNDPNCPVPPCRVFALGVTGRNLGMENLARSSNGMAAFVTDGRAVEKAVSLLLKQMRHTVVSDVEVRRGNGEAARKADGKAEMAFARSGDSWPCAIAWTAARGDKVAGYRISAVVNGRRVSEKYDLASLTKSDPNSLTSEDAEAIRRIHAHLKCQTRYPLIEKPDATVDDLAKLLGLCRRRHIVSSGSAMLVLERDDDYRDLGLVRTPTILPKDLGLSEEETWAPPEPKKPDRLKRDKQFEKDLRSQVDALLAKGKLFEAMVVSQSDYIAWDQRPQFCLYLTALQEFVRIRLDQRWRDDQDHERRKGRSKAWYEAAAEETPAQSVPTAARFAVDITPDLSPAEQERLAGLTEKAPKIDFEETELEQAFLNLAIKAGLDIDVCWPALLQAGLKKDAELTVSVKAGTARETLKAFLSAVKSKEPLAFLADGGNVIVTTESELPRVPLMKLYDLRPILCGLPCYRLWGEWDPFSGGRAAAGGGIFGGIFDNSGGAGIFSDPGPHRSRSSWGDDGSSNDNLTLSAREEDAHIPGSAFEVAVDPVQDELAIRQLEPEDWHSIFGERSSDPVSPAQVFPDRQRVAMKVIQRILNMRTDDPNRLSRDIETWCLMTAGTVAMRNSRKMHNQIARTIRQLNEQMRNGKLTDAYLPHWPESIFTRRATIEKWTAGLLEKASTATLSQFSSARIENLPGRRMVRIGGIWFDATLTAKAKIYTVARTSPAGLAVKKALGERDQCFDLTGPVIIPAGADMAICLDRAGIRDENDPDLKRLLAAFKAAPTARSEPSTKPAEPNKAD